MVREDLPDDFESMDESEKAEVLDEAVAEEDDPMKKRILEELRDRYGD
ncbi:MAG: hypothetical protein ABEK01_02485 [Candidatus Nanohaloarchaea archaeon]